MGTTGEAATTRQEKEKFSILWLKIIKKLPLVYGLAWNDTRQLIELIESLIWKVFWQFFSFSFLQQTNRIYRHYMEMADASQNQFYTMFLKSTLIKRHCVWHSIKYYWYKEASGDMMQCI
jgi:4-hydroxy-tetrahydrodipicolinate synthase